MEITRINPTSTAGLTLKRVAAYARVSSNRDTADHSLAQQISYYNEKIAQTPGVEWLRLHYAYPNDFPMDLLPVMAK